MTRWLWPAGWLTLPPLACLQANPHYAKSAVIPPYSCRSGLSVLIPTITEVGSDARPFKMKLERRLAQVIKWGLGALQVTKWGLGAL